MSSSIMNAVRNPALVYRLAHGGFVPGNQQATWAGEQQGWSDALQGCLLEGVRGLPSKHALVVIYRFGDGLTLHECGLLLGITRERVRQIEAAALRKLRGAVRRRRLEGLLREVVVLMPTHETLVREAMVQDPNWITVREAVRLTELTEAHICYLVKQAYIHARPHPQRGGVLQVYKPELKVYVLGSASHGRRKGVWHGE